MKKACMMAFALLALPAAAEPLSYDYIYLSSSDAQGNDSQDRGGEAFGGFWEFAETLHLFGSWDDGAYTPPGNNPGWRYDTRSLRAGIGGHYLLGSRFMLAPSVAVIRAEREITAPGWTREYTDTGYSMQLDARYAVSNWLELTAGSRSSRVFDASDTEFVGGIVFHPFDWLALGASYRESDAQHGTELVVKWYY